MPTAAKALSSALLALGGITSTSSVFADESAYPSQVFCGDTHLHSNLSGDAFSMGLRLDPDTAYRFAKGEAVTSTGGREVRHRFVSRALCRCQGSSSVSSVYSQVIIIE